MNKIYRAIWNESTRTWVAASELAKSKTKANSVSGQTGASLPSLGKSGMNAFKLGLLASLVHLSLAIPNAYAAGRTGLTGVVSVGSNTGAGAGIGNTHLSNNSVILAGDNNDYCGADHVKSRSTIGNATDALEPLEEYLRFAKNSKFTVRNKEFNPYGTTEAVENWRDNPGGTAATGQGTTGNSGYQNGLTGGVQNLLPRAFGINSFALGCAAYVTGNHGLAFGTNATSTAGGAQAFGIAALAGGRASNAIGISSQATGVSGVALGSVATADGNGSVALGLQAKASANSTVAVGVQSQAGVDSAVAIGNNSKASGKQSISIGSDNDISGEGSIAIGSSATATKFKQEDGTLETVATGKTRISGNHILSLGNSNTGKTSEDAITASDTAIFGNNNTIAANVGVHIIGNNNKIDIVNSDASATIIGNHASVSAGNGLALGNQTIVNGRDAVAIGNGAQATAEGAVALGAGSVADRAGNIAGYNPDSSVTATDPATNTPVWKSTTGAVAVGNANITRRITDVMVGTQDTDAANFGQLKSLSSSLPVSVDSLSTSISESLPKVDPVISSTTNSISTAIDDFNSEINKFSPDVNKKLSEIDTKITAISASISESITPLRRDALLYENGVYNAGHKDGQAHKIIHVAADENLSADSTYMVNGGQLYTTNSGITSLSVTAKNQLGSLNDSISSSVSANQNLGQVSADLQANKEKVLALQKDVLQWKDSSYSADHGTGKAQIITNVAAGNIAPDSTDAINGSQLHSLSTVTESGLSTAASGLSSLSVSTATGLNSLSSSINSSLSNANEGVTELKQDALQWNGKEYDAGRNGNIQKITNVAAGTVGENSTDAVNAGQLFKLSNSTSTGLSDLASSLSTIADTHISSLSSGSQSLSTIGDNIVSLSTSFEQTNGRVTALQQNALQWNGQVYDATRGGRTQKLTGITAGRVEADSTDAINGSQLHSLSTVTESGLSTAASGLSSLSVSTATGLNSLSSSINSSLSNANEGVTELKQDALQWNGKEYDAGRNGNIQKITNVAAGTVGENSTDAVNAGQLFKLSNSTSTGLSDLASSLSTIADTHISSLSSGSQSLSTIGDNIVSLSTSFEQTNGRVTALQQNALQWNGQVYDATRGGRTQTLTGITAGRVEADSTDAINGSQLHSLSTVTESGLSTAASGLNSLSVSTATGLNSLSSSINSSLSNANEGVTELKQDALQWNGKEYDAGRNGNIQKITNVAAGTVGENSTDAVNAGQLFKLSNSTSTGLSDLASSLSTIADTHISSLSSGSQSLSTIGDNIVSLSTSFEQTNGSVTALQQNALQWNGQVYDATRDGSTQTLTGITAGRVEADSTDAINGSQLHSLSTVTQSGLSTATSGLNSLSVSTATGLNSLSSSINSSLSNANEGVTELKQDALQWNGKEYDAGRNGNIQKITNVAAGTVGENSTDAVNAGQLFKLSNSTSTGLSDLASSLSTIADTHISSLSSGSQSLSTIGDNIVSLSTSFEQTNGRVTALQQNALQWNGQVYDATRGGRTQKLTGITAGRVEADSTDAINGSQLHSLSTVTESGLSTAASGLSSLSVSTATGLNSLSSSINSSLSNANEGVTELKQDALQWNGKEYDAGRNGNIQKITNVAAGTVGENSTDAVNAGQLFKLSNSTSTGLSDLASSLSTIADTHISSLSSGSQSLSTIGDNIVSLSTSFEQTNGRVTALQQNALQWNGQVYDATRGGRTQKLTGITAGRVEADSTDAINGSQLDSLSTVTQTGLDTATSGLNSLSVSTATGLNSLSSSLSSSLSNANQSLTELEQNALQWNGKAYDAGRNGNIQKIINVAAGTLGENSTDAVNAGQLFSLSNSTSTGLSSLSTAVSDIGSISVSMSTGYNELLNSLSTTQDQLGQLETSTNNKLTSLDTDYQTIHNDVDKLKKENRLQWNNDLGNNGEGGFDASRPNSLTRAPSYGKIVNLADGSLEPDSHEAVNGGQLRIVKDDLLSLSSSASTGLSSISSMVQDTPIAQINNDIGNLQENTLQWNGTAYDATHNGTAQRITNVAAGRVRENSTDAVNNHQLWEVRNDLNSLSTTVNNLPTGGNISQDALNNLSASISTSVANQLRPVAEAIGTNLPPSGIIPAPNYEIYAPNGERTVVHNVRTALENIQNNGASMYAKINSSKQASQAKGEDSIAIGGNAVAQGTSAIAIGDSASAPESNSVALGKEAKVTQDGGVALGAGSVANRAGGRGVGEVYIPPEAKGNDRLVSAIEATRSKEYGAVSVGNTEDGQYRQITGVAAGTEDTDAVNVAQLKGVSNQISKVNEYVNQLNDNLHHVERRAYSGTAMAMALSGAYLPSLSSGGQAVGIGVGTYRSYGAIGVNYKAASKNGKITWGAGVSTTGKEAAVNSAIGFKW